jgi:hypothetical protein
LVVLTLFLVAMMQIGRGALVCPTKRTDWALTVLLAPVFGPTAWFEAGDRLRLD